MKARFLLNEHSLSFYSHTSVWLWLTSVLALGFVLGVCICAAAVSGERQSDERSFFFTPCVKSIQIGLLDEWTCLCSFHSRCPSVMAPLLHKVNHHCGDEPWNNPVHLLSCISRWSLVYLCYCVSLTRRLHCPHKNTRKAWWTFGVWSLSHPPSVQPSHCWTPYFSTPRFSCPVEQC